MPPPSSNHPRSMWPNSPPPGIDAPVFIMGCPRSGTTLLYHMLVSSGHFVNYRSEVHAFSVIGPKFGQLKRQQDRELFLRHWLPTRYCQKTGLDDQQLSEAILNECSSPADFLAIIMRLMAESQSRNRWAECTPANVFHLEQIHAAFPNAKFVHMVRDGRDVALSLARQHWITPLPWDRGRELSVAALFWQRNVNIGTRAKAYLGDSYRELRFEDLVQQPAKTLEQLSNFVGEDLDYEHILSHPVGSVHRPNTSFGDNRDFSPVGRWHDGMTADQLARVEGLIGNTLVTKGYKLSQPLHSLPPTPVSARRAIYKTIWSLKHWMRTQTLMGRLTDMSLIRESSVAQTTQPEHLAR